MVKIEEKRVRSLKRGEERISWDSWMEPVERYSEIREETLGPRSWSFRASSPDLRRLGTAGWGGWCGWGQLVI